MVNTKEKEGFALLIALGIFALVGHFVFSLVFYRERLMVDGSYMIFEMCNDGWFPEAQNRYIIWLLDFLPVLAINLNLSLKTVIISWNVNYFLFYLICFCIATFHLRSITAGWVIIGLRCFTTSTCFFNIANEILPGGVLLVLLLTILVKKPAAKAALLFLAFFVAFGHLLVLVTLLLLVLYVFINARPILLKTLRENKWLLGSFMLFIGIRMLLALNEPYESGKLSLSVTAIESLTKHLNLTYITGLANLIRTAFPAVGIISIILIAGLIAQKNYLQLVTAFALIGGYTLIWLLYTNPDLPESMNRFNHHLLRWLFPALFMILALFFSQVALPLTKTSAGKYFILSLFLVFLTERFSSLYLDGARAENTISQLQKLISYARQSEHTKFYIPRSSTCPHVYVNDFYTATVIYSSLQGPDSTRHIVLARGDELNLVSSAGSDDYYLESDYIFSQKLLNPHYFKLKEEAYLPMRTSIDCSGMKIRY